MNTYKVTIQVDDLGPSGEVIDADYFMVLDGVIWLRRVVNGREQDVYAVPLSRLLSVRMLATELALV
jgi:hypothetical protein